MGTLDFDFERDWSVVLDATLGDDDGHTDFFSVSGIFLGKADSVILLGFECSINPQNLIKFIEPFLRK